MAPRIGSLIVVVMLGVVAFGCGDGYNGSPTTPTTPSTPTLVSLQGRVTGFDELGDVIVGATVAILDGANAGRTATTDSEGLYQIQGLTQGNANFSVRAPGFLELRTGGFINGDRADFVLQPAP
jgi:hypothetical protein